jgi:hypothetical protein
MTGVSARNLKYMRAFSEAWPDEAIVQQLAAQIPWFHQLIAEVEEEKRTRPTTPEEDAREDEALRRYGVEQAKKLNIGPTMREIDRLIHEHRKLRRLWQES